MRHLILLAALAPVLLFAGAIAAAATGDAVEIRTAAKAFMWALLKGDAAGAELVADASPEGRRFLKAMALNLSGEARLDAAIEKRFGPTRAHCSPARVADVINQSTCDVRGRTAELGRPGGETLPMRKVGTRWKVDAVELAARHDVAGDALALAEARGKARQAIIANVEAGRYATAAAALADRGDRYAAAERDVAKVADSAHASTAP
jgi:hypothetical protein